MRHMRIRRASVLALALLLATAGIAAADSVFADGDALQVGNQNLIDLGKRAPGEVVTHDVTFNLVCGSAGHADAGETITVQASSFTAPLNGALAATVTTIGPVPASWTPDGEGCPSPSPTLASNGASTATLTMPTTPGEGYIFTIMYSRLGTSGLVGVTAISFEAEVVGNTPPMITLPDELIVEGTEPGGATVSYDVETTDAEDEPDPTASCTPASGAFFALGTTTVACSVTDTGELSASGTFDVTVEDTTAPTLAGVPDAVNLVTSNRDGATLAYAAPTASDAVDDQVPVTCSPASGAFVAVGPSSVSCTATDDSGNSTSASFPVVVTYDPPITWSAVWGEPVSGSPPALSANPGRTVPIKVDIFADGVEVTDGAAWLRVVPCGGGAIATVSLAWSSGRWTAHLDTATLRPGCNIVTAIAGEDAGSFTLNLRGGEAAKAQTKKVLGSKPTDKGPRR
jgi:hypothetical protein